LRNHSGTITALISSCMLIPLLAASRLSNRKFSSRMTTINFAIFLSAFHTRLTIPIHRDKYASIEVGSEITVLTPGPELLIGIRSVVNIQLCSTTAGTRLVRNVLQAHYSPKAFNPQNLIEGSLRLKALARRFLLSDWCRIVSRDSLSMAIILIVRSFAIT
jgi:hypothetical protein